MPLSCNWRDCSFTKLLMLCGQGLELPEAGAGAGGVAESSPCQLLLCTPKLFLGGLLVSKIHFLVLFFKNSKIIFLNSHHQGDKLSALSEGTAFKKSYRT